MKVKPNGSPPAEGCGLGPLGLPFLSTVYVVIMLVTFSLTTSTRPEGVKLTSAGDVLTSLSGCVDPDSGESPQPKPTVKPLMLSLAVASTLASLSCPPAFKA